MRKTSHVRDEYGFLADLAELEDADPSAAAPPPSRMRPKSESVPPPPSHHRRGQPPQSGQVVGTARSNPATARRMPAAPRVRVPAPPQRMPEPALPEPFAAGLAPVAPAPDAPHEAVATAASRPVAADLMRQEVAAPAVVASRPVARPAYAPPSKKSVGGGFELPSFAGSGKPLGIAAAVAAALALGCFSVARGYFAGGLNAGAVYEEVVTLNREFEGVSAKGPASPEFTAFYERFQPRYRELYAKMGTPSTGTTAYKVKAAVGHLNSVVEGFKRKLEKSEQRAFRDELRQTLEQVKKEREG